MGRSQESFSKREKEKKKQKKKQEKMQKKEERQAESTDSSLESMMAYVDEYGNIVDTPPDEQEKEEIKAEDIVVGVPKKGEYDVPVDVHEGKIEYFNDAKGFGFIREDGTNEKIFVHVTELQDEVTEEDRVTYDVVRNPKGLNAVKVKKL
jgi:cold shock CspA family protein